MPRRSRLRTATTATVVGTVGLVTWMTTMASAPRYSYGVEQNMGNAALFPILLAAAVVSGLVVPTRAALAGAMLGLPGLVLSPWTAPRGDNDGLWFLIVPLLAMFTVLLIVIAAGAAWARIHWADRAHVG